MWSAISTFGAKVYVHVCMHVCMKMVRLATPKKKKQHTTSRPKRTSGVVYILDCPVEGWL